LLRDVAQLAQYNKLVDAFPRLRKGALIAQDPDAYEELKLDDDGRNAGLWPCANGSSPWRFTPRLPSVSSALLCSDKAYAITSKLIRLL
jgi:hypothetical protein